MMSKSTFSRILSLLLAAAMTLSLIPASALAAEPDDTALPPETQAEELLYDEAASADEDSASEESIPEVETDSSALNQTETPAETEDETQLATTSLPAADSRTRWITADSASDIASFLRNSWSEHYFRKAVIDTGSGKVTVDGHSAGVAETFGENAAEADILENAEAAEEYFSDSVYEIESADSDTLTVTAPYQSCRIILSAEDLSESYGAETILKNPLVDEYILQFSTEEATRSAFRQMKKIYGKKCFVDEILWADDLLSAVTYDGITFPYTSDSGLTTYSWGSSAIGAMSLKENGDYTGKSATVAVIDTGVDTDNWFFEGRTISEKSKDLVTGKTGKANMKDYAGNTTSTGHGTHVAGIIADCTPDSVSLLAMRIFDDAGESSWAMFSSAIDYAVEQNVDIINMSLGDSTSTSRFEMPLESHLSVAREAGIPVVCAAGNDSVNVANSYPACSPLTIAVSALNESLSFASSYSGYGKEIDFCAPGSLITSALLDGQTRETTVKSGTSMAAPHITAAMTYLIMDNPTASVQSLYDLLTRYCRDLGEPGKDQYYGNGCPLLVSGTHAHDWKDSPQLSAGNYLYSCASCTETMTVPAYCGEDIRWTLKGSTLTLSGSGAMYSYSNDDVPWSSFTDRIQTLTVKSGIIDIGSSAFENLPSLKTLNLPLKADGGTLERIGDFAFFSCTSLKNPTIPATVTELGTAAFAGCDSITKFAVEEGSTDYMTSSLGFLWTRDEKGNQKNLYACPTGYSVNGSSFTYSVNCSTVMPYAFYRCLYLSKLVFGSSVKTVGTHACANMPALRTVYFAGDRPTISSDAFYGVKTTLAAYPDGAANWSSNNSQYGGTLNWKTYYPDLKNCVLSMEDEFYYTGSAVKPSFTLTSNGIKLISTDYNVSYQDNDKIGTATVTFTGKNAYKGTLSKTFRILGKEISALDLTVKPATYTGSAVNPVVTIKDGDTLLKQGVDYTISCTNNVEVGIGSYTITGQGNYPGSLSGQFEILPCPVSKLTVSLSSTSATYTGKAIKPGVTVKLGNKKLVKNTDYTIVYSKNTAVGTATVTVNGKGSFTGSVKKSFSIVPKTTSVSSASSKKSKQLTVKWKKNTIGSGYQVQVAANKSFTKNKKTKTVTKNSTVSVTLTGLKAKTKYYIRIRTQKVVGEKTYYSAWKTYSKTVKTK